MRPISKLFQAVSIAAVAVAALSLSATPADAKSRGHHRHGHGHHRHACAVRHAYVPVYAPAYVPAPVIVHRPVIARPVIVYPQAPVVVVPAPYAAATVVYDRDRDGVDGFIGVSGPRVSIGIGF